MKKLFMLFALFLQAGGQQVSIPIVDPDFESQAITNGQPITDPAGCGTAQGFDKIAGWTFTHLVAGSGGGVAHWACDDGAPNSNVAFLGGGEAMEQVLTEMPRFGVYVLQFDVANWFYSYSGDWNAVLYMSTRPDLPICSQSGWAMGDMNRVTVTCIVPGGTFTNSQFGPLGNVIIHFQNGVPNPALGGHAGWPVLIDNVSLTFTPVN